MDNITIEQRRKTLDEIIKSEDFKKIVENIVNNKLTYYDWLQNNLPVMSVGEFTFSKKYVLNYFYHCMLMDESNDENVVYFIRNEYTGLLKIGKTNNLSRRITEIERCFNFLGLDTQKLVIEAISYCPFGINNGKVETFYHNLFKEKRKNGEWFDVSYEELMNTLYCDYIINGVIVAVENITDFPDGAKTICLEEENVEILRKNIENNLVEKLSKELCIFDNIFKFNKKETIPSEKLYNYLIGLKKNDGNLDNKIKHRIEHILEFMD